MPCYKTNKIIVVQQTLVYDIKEEKLVLMAYFWHIQKHFTPSCTFIASFNIAKRLLVLTGKCMVPEKGILSPCYMNPYQGEQISVYKYSNLDISKNKAIRLPQPLTMHTLIAHQKNHYTNFTELPAQKTNIVMGLFTISLDDTPYCDTCMETILLLSFA